MISGVNGFSANVNYDFSSVHERNLKPLEEKEVANLAPNLTARIDYDTVNPEELDYDQLKIWADNVDPEKLTGKKLSMWLGAKMEFDKVEDGWRKELGLNPNEPVAVRRIFSLSGYTRDDKISVWGKINGLDSSVSKEKAAELKSFVDSTRALIAHARDPSDIFRRDVFSVDKFMKRYDVDLGGFGLGLMRSGSGVAMDAEASRLLNSDMSEEEFKDKWLEYAANKILGEYANVKISLKDGALNFDQTPAKERITLLGQDLETRVSYADEPSKKEFFKFLKDVFKNGESIGDALQKIALKKGDFDETVKEEEAQADAAKEKKFKPIKATSKSQTYVYKDIKREFFEKFIKAEQEKGTDIMDLLRKIGKMGLDLKV